DCRETWLWPMLVILKRRLLALKDLSVPREHSRAFCANAKSRVWHATLTTATREVKATQSSVNPGRFGLFSVLLGRFSTGSSLSAPASHQLNGSDHSVPLLSTSYRYVVYCQAESSS